MGRQSPICLRLSRSHPCAAGRIPALEMPAQTLEAGRLAARVAGDQRIPALARLDGRSTERRLAARALDAGLEPDRWNFGLVGPAWRDRLDAPLRFPGSFFPD